MTVDELMWLLHLCDCPETFKVKSSFNIFIYVSVIIIIIIIIIIIDQVISD